MGAGWKMTSETGLGKRGKRAEGCGRDWGVAFQIKETENEITYKIANFRGLRLRMGKRVKQTTKRARAARLRPPKRRRRSQRLTVGRGQRGFLG